MDKNAGKVHKERRQGEKAGGVGSHTGPQAQNTGDTEDRGRPLQISKRQF